MTDRRSRSPGSTVALQRTLHRKRMLTSLFRVIVTALLLLYSVTAIYPLLWMVLNSLKTQGEFILSTFTLPTGLRLEGYRGIFATSDVYRALGNSVFASLVSVVFILLLAFPVSYLLARFTFRGKGALRLYFMAGILVPTYGLLVPVFVLFKNIGMLDNRATILFPMIAFNLPVAIFLFESYIQTIPVEIEESVFMDGALLRHRLWHVVAPISAPIMATVVIVDALSTWNEFGFPLVLLRGQQFRTVPLWLNTFVGEHTVSYPGLMGAMVVASIPVVVTYLFLSNRIIEGMTAGALRG